MSKRKKWHGDKLELAAKVLFELPPSDSLPVFKRLSYDSVKILLDHVKAETQEGRGPSAHDSSVFKIPIARTHQATSTNALHIDDGPDANRQTIRSLTEMNCFATLADDEIKTILKHCDTSFWAPALKNSPPAIQQKIMNCMAPVAARLLKIEIDKVGSVNEQEEKLAREGIMHAAIHLATNRSHRAAATNSRV